MAQTVPPLLSADDRVALQRNIEDRARPVKHVLVEGASQIRPSSRPQIRSSMPRKAQCS